MKKIKRFITRRKRNEFANGIEDTSEKLKPQENGPMSPTRKGQGESSGGTTCDDMGEALLRVNTMQDSDIRRNMERCRAILRQNVGVSEGDLHHLRRLVESLIQSGNDHCVYTHRCHRSDCSLMCEAIIHDRAEVLAMLADIGFNVNASSSKSETLNLPLHLACYLGKLTFVQFLLDRGADPDRKCGLNLYIGDTEMTVPAHDAYGHAMYRDSMEVIRVLLKHASSKGTIPKFILHQCCRLGAQDCLRFLAQQLASQACNKDEHDRTPLSYAFWKNPAMAFTLAEINPDVTKWISADVATEMLEGVCKPPPGKLGPYDRGMGVRFLVKYGQPDLNKTDNDGNTILHHLLNLFGISSFNTRGPWEDQESFNSHILSALEQLLVSGANPNIQNNSRHPPMMHLLRNRCLGDPSMIKYESGSDIKMKLDVLHKGLAILLQHGAAVVGEPLYNPLTQLASLTIKLSAHQLGSVHSHIREMLTLLWHAGADLTQKDGYGHPMLLRFMYAYLASYSAATSRRSLERASNDFPQIFQIFVKASIPLGADIILRTPSQKTFKSSYMHEILYAMGHDVALIHEVRGPLCDLCRTLAHALRAQGVLFRPYWPSELNCERAPHPAFRFESAGITEMEGYLVNLLQKAPAYQSAMIAEVIMVLITRIPVGEQTPFKHNVLGRAKRAGLHATKQEALETALLKK